MRFVSGRRGYRYRAVWDWQYHGNCLERVMPARCVTIGLGEGKLVWCLIISNLVWCGLVSAQSVMMDVSAVGVSRSLLASFFISGARMRHDGGDGSPLALQRSSHRARGGHHGSGGGHANTHHRSAAAETGQATILITIITIAITELVLGT